MSDAPRDDTWWQASDGKWYPPQDQAPHPGWWLASDGNWYPPQSGTAATKTQSDGSAKPAPASAGARAGRSRERAKPQPLDKPPASAKSPAKSPVERSTSAKPAAKSTRPPAAAATTRATAPSGARPLPGARPNPNDGLSPQEQIARRNLASQADRQVLARSRSLAASRLLASVTKEQNGDARPQTPVSDSATRTTARAAKPGTAKSGTAKPTPKTPPASPADPSTATEAEQPTSPNGPLLEVKQSALAADIEHLGERLAIFNDRVELRDRHNVVRQVVLGVEIADIVVHKRLTGAVLTIETVEGPVMVAKGLRPEQAEEARQLIMRKTRPSGPVQKTGRPAAKPSPLDITAPTAPGHIDVVEQPTTGGGPGERVSPTMSTRPIDEADVLRKLGDLHRLGILTTEEYEDKIALVGSLVRGEITLPA